MWPVMVNHTGSNVNRASRHQLPAIQYPL